MCHWLRDITLFSNEPECEQIAQYPHLDKIHPVFVIVVEASSQVHAKLSWVYVSVQITQGLQKDCLEQNRFVFVTTLFTIIFAEDYITFENILTSKTGILGCFLLGLSPVIFLRVFSASLFLGGRA